jgi:hypothetical protein
VELFASERFGQDIRVVGLCRDVDKADNVGSTSFTDAVICNGIVLLLEYAGWYGRVHDHTIVVTEHEGRSINGYANHSQMIAVL